MLAEIASPLPHPLRCCAGTATSSQPSTMAPRTGVQADLPRRKTSVSSWYVWHGRTRHADIRACRAHSRTSDMNLGATPSRGLCLLFVHPPAHGSEVSPAARNTLDSARIPRASKLLICGLFLKGRVLAQDGQAGLGGKNLSQQLPPARVLDLYRTGQHKNLPLHLDESRRHVGGQGSAELA